MGELDNSGLRQATRLCQMRYDDRLTFLAEGLPIILKSSRGFWAASQQIKEISREADVLKNHAEEEAAKILIIMDMVRCPKKLCASKMGAMVIDLGLIVGADAVAEAGEPLRQLGPEDEALADRHLVVNRPERGNVLTLHLPGDAPGLHQASLKASALLPEAHEHCTGIAGRILFNQEKSCHYRNARALKAGDTEAVAGSSDDGGPSRRRRSGVARREMGRGVCPGSPARS